ncbi:uncharacterized protein ATNIH1004_002705 [Aspergillus tanneri]|uniref:Uncharacterized protein n=1 Tax=Aspergillus tanneri TaxID=1220188 RepID=A0A5M9MSJ1_9EURO|nr:uncharacterized protein ATNIH1004_002705 [Aspergillus tanneri]KAA8650025.1 hypothetical protein ATNIH1004_002705 [Aspergillus tanneri]
MNERSRVTAENHLRSSNPLVGNSNQLLDFLGLLDLPAFLEILAILALLVQPDHLVKVEMD